MSNLLNPTNLLEEDWTLWRLAYKGGPNFVSSYLQQYSAREEIADFNTRKQITYCPRFAGAAVDEVKNSIYNRFTDIERLGGSASYKKACQGDQNGVDLLGRSMNAFIGTIVLPELLVMGAVGVYVDSPRFQGRTLKETLKYRPYVYIYQRENIKNWLADDSDTPNEYSAILLEEEIEVFDEQTGFPIGTETRERYMVKREDGIYVRLKSKSQGTVEYMLNIPKIPFVRLEISQSLMTDVAQYQVALLNLASSDLGYALKSNFPFYTEQVDKRAGSTHLKGETEVKTGVATGRQYSVGAERPGFIHPSSEPLKASMEKQAQLKAEIRQLIGLTITNLNPLRQASAESKNADARSLESGLSYIGLELEYGENKIAEFWSMYENTEKASVIYPRNYNIKTDEEIWREAENLEKRISKITSRTAQKELMKRLARLLLGTKVPSTIMTQIENEIDASHGTTADIIEIVKDLDNGLVDRESAAQLRGYTPEMVKKASEEHIERLRQISISQSKDGGAARGLKDLSVTPEKDAQEEKNGGTAS